MAKFFSKFSENYQLINQEAHYTLSSRSIKENELFEVTISKIHAFHVHSSIIHNSLDL